MTLFSMSVQSYADNLFHQNRDIVLTLQRDTLQHDLGRYVQESKILASEARQIEEMVATASGKSAIGYLINAGKRFFITGSSLVTGISFGLPILTVEICKKIDQLNSEHRPVSIDTFRKGGAPNVTQDILVTVTTGIVAGWLQYKILNYLLFPEESNTLQVKLAANAKNQSRTIEIQ